ncbi:MAG: TAXI family TRAP transporter solute-binding subunit [Gemmatimonas sp.]
MSAVALATSDVESPFHVQGVALGAMWKDLRVVDEVMPLFTTGGFENARLVANHSADCGLISSNWLARAASGERPFDARLPLRLMTPLSRGPLFFVAPRDSRLQTFDDLMGKRVGVGHRNSGMVEHVRTIFAALGIPFTAIEPCYLHSNEGNRLLLEGEIHAQFEPPYPNPHFDELSRQIDLKILSFSPEQRRRILDAVPYYSECVVPQGTFRGHDRDATEIAVTNVLAVHANEAEGMVFRLASSVLAHCGELMKRNPLFHGLDDLLRDATRKLIPALANAGAPLHPGAERAFREAGILV